MQHTNLRVLVKNLCTKIENCSSLGRRAWHMQQPVFDGHAVINFVDGKTLVVIGHHPRPVASRFRQLGGQRTGW